MEHLIVKYERTPHLEGSRHQVGDSPNDLKIAEINDEACTFEEKLDGANSGVSFDHTGRLYLQSRGHFLNGGGREAHFSMFKTWANTHSSRFHEVLGSRFRMYGEWCFAKHTVFYDALPAYFFEFDVLDMQDGNYLSTDARRELLFGLPIVPVPVLARKSVKSVKEVQDMVKPSLYRTPNWKEALVEAAEESKSRLDMVMAQSDMSELSEGLYGKREANGIVHGRFKFVRGDFLQTILDSDSHWHDRPILPNRLADGIDIFAYETGVPGAYDDPDALS